MANQREIEPAVLTLKEAARYVRMNEPDFRKMVHSGRIRAFLTPGGGSYRIPREELNRYIEEQLDLYVGLSEGGQQ